MVKLSEYPQEGELVVATVRDVKGFGAFVTMDEYDHKEGFVHIAEVATGWVKYIRDYIREGQKVVCRVLRVEQSRGHVDLSLKQVNDHQKRDTVHAWKNEAKAEKLFKIVCQRAGQEEQAAYQEYGLNLVRTFGTMYSAFEETAITADILESEGFTGDWIKHFQQVAQENIVPPYVRIKGFLDLRSHMANGVEIIRDALAAAEKADDAQVKVTYIGAPKYCLNVQAKDYKVAEEALKQAANRAIQVVSKSKGAGVFNREE